MDKRPGAEVLVEHLIECTDAQAVIVKDGSADEIVADLIAHGWTLAEREDHVAGKRIRFLQAPADVNIQTYRAGKESLSVRNKSAYFSVPR